MSVEEFIQHQAVSGCLTMEDRQYLELRDVERVIQMAICAYREKVWHDSGCEDPEEGKAVLVIGGKKIGLVRKFRSNGGGVGYDCKWASIEDLLPPGIKMEDINV